ncbi:MAG: 2,3-bisphosphoglycerate-independent phosphoglycerate mutase [Deltaproteobacteria bacterium]|nr:2,3-bisphosphoglycerate-independent phosphoglycerate mutase [Deltaproteobacteria bacterium]
MNSKPECVVLIIADGWGVSATVEGNAIAKAKTPVIDRLFQRYPHTTLQASGLTVGLPEGQMGNSEVGHLNMGAGRVVYQDLTRISKSIADGTFAKNQVLLESMEEISSAGGTLHLMGLFSDGGVHSHLDHLKALLEMAADRGLPQVFIHAFLDGRDTPPTSAKRYLEDFQRYLDGLGTGRIATIMGRFYAMDRDQRWERVQQAYEAMVGGQGRIAGNVSAAIDVAYEAGETDEFVKPTVLADGQGQAASIHDGDGIIFFNFRADRAREITRAFTEKDLSGFGREQPLSLNSYVCFTEYDASFDLPVAFPPEELKNVLAEVVAAAGLRQLHIAETEKYAHVTFFFNGGREEPFPGEDHCLIPSPREVKTYDEKPQMSAYEVTAEMVRRLEMKKYQLVILNFANGDMVGHTGNLAAAIQACEAVDTCVGQVVDKTMDLGGVALFTADHGNAEQMLTPEGKPITSHSTNPVPCIVISEQFIGRQLREGGSLADLAPTILEIMGLAIPPEMTGKPLIM